MTSSGRFTYCPPPPPIRNQKLSITTKSCESRVGTADRIESLKRGSANQSLLDRAQRNPDNFVPSPASDPRIPNPRKRKEPQTGANQYGIRVVQSTRKQACRPPRGTPAKREASPMGATPYPPTDSTAVLSATAGLTAGFGMGPGDPRLHGRAHGGCSPWFSRCGASARHPGGRIAQRDAHPLDRTDPGVVKRRARAISNARLNGSPRLQLRPIDQVVYLGPYQRGNSSRRRLPA